MPKTLIQFGDILKRSTFRNAKSKANIINESNSIEKNYRTINNSIDNNTKSGINSIRIYIDRILESLTDSNLANKYKFYPLNIVEKVNSFDNSLADSTLDRYCTIILPYIDDMTSILEMVHEYKFTEKQKDTLIREANVNLACDRILNNHNIISKRFNVDEVISKNKYNLSSMIESFCVMIDTYDRESYQKMNICLEEVFYLLEKNDIKYDKISVVNSIVEYFLLSSPELTERNLNGYKKCIQESSFISECDINNIEYLFKGNREENTQSSNIRSIIASFYTSPLRTKESLYETISNCLDSDTLDISYNFSAITDFILTVYKLDNLISDNELEVTMEEISKKISVKLISLASNADISKDILGKILSGIIDKIEEAKFLVTSYPRVIGFINYFKSIIELVSPYFDMLYDNDNINTINMIENCTKEIPLKEGQLWKAHNLFVAVRNLDKFIADKCKKVANKLVGKGETEKKETTTVDGKNQSVRQKINNLLFNDDKGEKGSWFDRKLRKGLENEKKFLSAASDQLNVLGFSESYNPYSYISEESHMFDIILSRITFDKDEIIDVQDSIASICKEFNYILEMNSNINNCRLYYLTNPGEVELHLVENAKYILSDDELKLVQESSKVDLDYSITKLAEASAIAGLVDSINNKDIETSLFNYFSNDKDMNINQFETILEALSLLEVDKSIVEKFADKYTNHKYYTITEDAELESECNSVNILVNEYKVESNVPAMIQLEAYALLDAILEEYTSEDFKKKDNKEDSDDDYEDEEDDTYEPTEKHSEDNKEEDLSDDKTDIKKNPFKGLNLKSIKLAMMGLKSKFKNMSQKQKEAAKNLDTSMSHLVSGIKNSMISDSRESIIKGSVIPSFSKCIKLGALFAGLNAINPGIAAATAIGSFAVSKHLTKKERILLLDEIDTELDVVDKEIAMAEREEDMKRYRALLQYKKNLQRQYQRIRYNVKVGKNILPGSNTGINKDHNNGY